MNKEEQTFIVNGKEYGLGVHKESCPHCNWSACECLCKECRSGEEEVDRK